MNLEDRQRRNRLQISTEPAYGILATDCLDGVLIFRNGDPLAKPVPVLKGGMKWGKIAVTADEVQKQIIEKGEEDA